MTQRIVDRATWLQERASLLAREKAATRELDALAEERQALPWVRVEQDYTLETSQGPRSLSQLFGSHDQLIVYHFMYGPNWRQPCDGCSAWAAALNGTLEQIHAKNAELICVSRAPIEQILAVQAERGWTFTWASSYASSFNRDFHMSADEDCPWQDIGTERVFYDRGESGGINVFAKTSEGVYHTYSAHNRGIQQMNGAFGYVDLLPYGGN